MNQSSTPTAQPSSLGVDRMKASKALDAVISRLNSAVQLFESHFLISVSLFFLAALAVRFFFTPFDVVLREDGYAYLTKGLAITRGDFSPVEHHSIGWPLLMSPFLFFFNDRSIFDQMTIARSISLFVGALSIFPLALIGRRFMDGSGVILLLVLFTFSALLIGSSYSVYTEPLFTLLLLTTLYFSLKSQEAPHHLLFAAFFAALAFWARPNGLFLLPIIFLAFFLFRSGGTRASYWYLLYIVAVFFIVSSPFLYQRYAEFGSPLSYGENNKIFVDSYQQVWSENVPNPSLIEYLQTHSVRDYFNKFVIRGGVRIIWHYTNFIVPPILFFLVLYGIIYSIARGFSDRRLLLVLSVFAVWFIGLVPAYDIFGSPRHLVPTMPLLLLISAIGFLHLFNDNRYRTALMGILIAPFLVMSVIAAYESQNSAINARVTDGVVWARWVAENVSGKLATIEGADLIKMNLLGLESESLTRGGSFQGPARLTTIRPGYFKSVDAAMEWFHENEVTHLAIDDEIDRRPYLRDVVGNGQTPSYLNELYSNHDTESRWKMRIFEINWDQYDVSSVSY